MAFFKTVSEKLKLSKLDESQNFKYRKRHKKRMKKTKIYKKHNFLK